MTVLETLPARHDHAPAYTARLGAARGDTVTLRLKTTLPVTQVQLKLLEHGEISEYPTTEIPPLDGEGRWFAFELPLIADRVRYAWSLITADDHLNLTMSGLHHTRRAYRDWFVYLSGYAAPTWTWSSVFYQIFPDRFRNGDPSVSVRNGEYEYAGAPVYQEVWTQPITREGDIHAHYGGDLPGVRAALPYLTDLGVNALWLTPIFVSPSNHRYDISDYRRVDPHLGGDAAFDELLHDAHAQGVRVVLDGVFNHVGSENDLFRKAFADVHAAERALFTWRPNHPVPYHAFFDVPTLPKLDYASEAAAREFLDGPDSVVRTWLRRGIDGWRLDVAQMLGAGGTDEGNLELHRRLKRAAREERADAYVFGERFFDAEEALRGDGEDAAMNYHGFGLPVMQWLSGRSLKFLPSRMDGHELVEILWDAYHVLPPEVALNQFNLLDSHDTPRALYRLGGSTVKLRAALTLLMGYAGVPCMYYGTEVGLSQSCEGAMPWCREPMPWDESQWDTALRADVQALVRIRRDTPALQRGALRFLHVESDAVAFTRTLTHADGRAERAVVIASRLEAHTLTLRLPDGAWCDARSGEVLHGIVALEAAGGRLLIQS
ncbi:alpha-amylase family glycosyl hydrolase [Deinococcus maricopensis]|uniref:Neopullulanase n=1 Tax=Deinococcus maricopensis (strain DSM 21211 / LMG 22137 / NRRL B-23946 / LB-34) TaxID=709986 RepID=E8U7L0_DEIML|nr:alpha-amylase family glycosyl hydrolase [Deinococcus maricopensis]ADV67049.1 Neopullulanase [Deinococcus maricopensis DSM 21211]